MKRGFTLIELLAVIVILAIIALIATPIILNIIEDARVEANKRSIDLYANAIRNTIAKEYLKGTDTIEGTFTSSSTSSNPKLPFEVEYDGDVECEEIGIYKDGNIYLSGCKVNDVSIDYTYGTKQEKPCTLQDGYTPKTIGAKYSCDFGGEARNFYILELGSNPVTNSTLESDEVALILEGNYDATPQYWCDQAGDNPNNSACNADGLTGKLDEIAGVWTKLERGQIGLPSVEQLMVADGRSENEFKGNSIKLTNAWLYSWPDNTDPVLGYWTKNPAGTDSAWYVFQDGTVNIDGLGYYYNLYCVRPVITISTDDIG